MILYNLLNEIQIKLNTFFSIIGPAQYSGKANSKIVATTIPKLDNAWLKAVVNVVPDNCLPESSNSVHAPVLIIVRAVNVHIIIVSQNFKYSHSPCLTG